MGRRPLDQYHTPRAFVSILIDHLPAAIGNIALCEPCSGHGDISDPLLASGRFSRLITNDIDPTTKAQTHLDATLEATWAFPVKDEDLWVITNPPYGRKAAPIVQHALKHPATRFCAFLLRTSFLEPCLDRADMLNAFRPTKIISIPRHSFTGDGHNDALNLCWFIWDRNITNGKTDLLWITREELGQREWQIEEANQAE